MTEEDVKSSLPYQRLKDEFDRFFHAVSHDFNAPLRHIREFHNLLLESLDDKASDKEKQYIAIIQQSTGHMQAMLDALQEITQLCRQPMEIKCLKPRDVLTEAIAPYQPHIDATGLQIDIADSLPPVKADAELLRRVFFEIIGNSLMFRNLQAAPPTLTITGEKKGATGRLIFADNGIGIARSFLPDAFTIFRKQHTQPHHEGMGTGLTLCQTILRNLGGNIWLESESGKGCTVWVELPTC